MEFKHRKLFPTLTETNQTSDCLDFCDPSCPFNCYPDPDLIYIPPPPPPSSAGDQFNNNPPISPVVIIIVSLLISFFLLISYYAIIVKYCSNWNTSRTRPPPSQSDGTDDDEEEEEHLDENQGPMIDHPIWLITTVGLQQAIINSIAVCKYKRGEGLIEGTECLVCLSEFQEDETLRLLPKCSHAFHVHCIDTWLRSHTNCPLCRARIVTDTISPPLTSMELNSHNLSVNEETQMRNQETNGELGDNQVRNCENRTETEDEGELMEVDAGRMSKEGVNSNGNGVFRVLSDMVDNNNHQITMKGGIQPLGRSLSMDSSSSASAICLGLAYSHSVESETSSVNQILDVQKPDSDIVLLKEEDRNSSILKLMGSSSIEQTLRKSPISMKRSSSCGGRSFRSLSSILPL